MKKIVMFAGISLVLTSNVFASDNTFQEGKALFMQSCQMCHNAEVDPPMAPPMFAVQMKYKIATQDKESFIHKVTSFATHPTKDKAILKEAVKMLGVMPDMGFKESDVRKVALYIHDETFVPPCLHWKSAMKRFKDNGDMQHYKSHKKRYDMMCKQQGMQKTSEHAESGSLKAIMQQLGRDYTAVDEAILMEDFAAAAKAARGIAFHDTPSLGTKMKLMSSLGSEMSYFKKADGKVHNLALEIEMAAKEKNMKTLIAVQSQMLSACMACHTSFRSRIIKILE